MFGKPAVPCAPALAHTVKRCRAA